MSDVSSASYSDPGTHNSSPFSNTQIPLIQAYLQSQTIYEYFFYATGSKKKKKQPSRSTTGW